MSSEELEQEQDAGGLGPAEVNAEEGSDSLREPMSGQRLSEEGRLLKAIGE